MKLTKPKKRDVVLSTAVDQETARKFKAKAKGLTVSDALRQLIEQFCEDK